MLKPFVATAVALVIAAPAFAQDTAPASGGPQTAASTREAVDEAIQHQESRRSGAVAGMVVGGAAIVAGAVVDVVASAENQKEKDDGQPTTHNPYVGLIGLAVGLPIMGVSAYLFADSQKKLNGLRHQRLQMSYSPETGQPMLSLSADF